MAMLSYYGKFWLEDRLTVYWTGSTPPPWYVDATSPPLAARRSPLAARRSPSAYLVGLPGVAASCEGAVGAPLPTSGVLLPVEVVVVPSGGCAGLPPR